ncbi:MAG: ArsB/NhaD family transporter [Spirochaetia bacterium]|jgi:Na+/H+ antiporter NhaD/arsenite permease-like protein
MSSSRIRCQRGDAITTQQWIALGIFVLSYGLIISEKVNRTIVAIFGAVLAFIFVLGPGNLVQYENWETIIFVFGMMLIIETMSLSGFFRWLGLHSARWVKLDPLALFILFPLLTGFLSAFVDSITVMLFMSTLTLEVAAIIGINPLPLILAEISAANIGGSSTMVGDPPNVILGTYFGLSFIDFVKNTGLIAWIGFVVNDLFFIWFFRKEIFPARRKLREEPQRLQAQVDSLDPARAVQDKRLFAVGLIAIFYVVVALVSHSVTHLSVAVIAITGAVLALLLGGKHMGKVVAKIDYPTIVFFAGLFLIVGAMEHVGLLTIVAMKVKDLSGGNFFVAISIILWVSALGSSIVDNVPFAATMAPILKHLSGMPGFSLLPLVWSASLGTDIGGNGTPIGASANVVAVATYERETEKKIGWGYYCKVSYPAMMIVVLVCNLLMYLFYAR